MRRLVVLLAVFASAVGMSAATSAPATASAAAASAAANLVVSQTALDFGDTRMGTTSPFRTATVTNRGAAAVTLTGSYGSTGPFVQAGTCRGATLAAGATCTLTFLFRPTAVGPATATVTAVLAGVSLPVAVRGYGTGLFSISPTGFDFGGVPVGSTSPAQVVTITNVSGVTQVMNGAGGGAGLFGGSQDCQGHTLAPGASCRMFYAFSPTATGLVTGSTAVTWNGQSAAFTFQGAGLRQLQISPTSFDFGDVALGDPSPEQTVTVTNRGTSPVVMNGAGGGAGLFGGSQNCQGHTLAAGQSCQMAYRFTPTALGAVTGSTGVTWNGQSAAFTFKGRGVPRLLISPTSFDFGEVPLGSTSPPQTVTVTNRGASPIVMSGAGGGAGVFGGSQNCQGHTLAAGQSCQMSYAYTPSVAGARNGTTGGTWNGQVFSLRFTGTGFTGAPSKTFRISATGFDFGATALGSSAPEQTVTITNVGNAPVVGSIAGGGAGLFGGSQNCQGVTIAPGASCQIRYAFRPTALGVATGSTSGSFNGQPFAFTFRGTGVRQWLISPTAFDFGDTRPGSTAQQAVTIRNVGSAAAVGSIAGGAAGAFGGSQNCQGVTIAPGAACQVLYRFDAAKTGPNAGSTNGSFVGQPFAFTFAGNGRNRWLISPTRLDFGATPLGGTTPSQAVTITNLSDTSATGSIAGGGAGVYGGSQNCQGVAIAPGGSCRVSYAFTPATPGAAPGSTSGSFTGQPFAFGFTGYGVRDLLVSPLGLAWGAVRVGVTAPPLDVLVSNVSDHAVTLTATRPAAAAPFTVTSTCVGATLAAGASCRYRFTVQPSAAGALAVIYRARVDDIAFAVNLRATGRS